MLKPSTSSFFLLLLLLISLSLRLSGQAEQSVKLIDSLKNESNIILDDTVRINNLVLIGREYIKMNDNKNSVLYANKAKELAEKKEYEKGMAEAMQVIGLTNKNLGNFKGALQNFLEALAIYQRIGYNRGLASCYINIGNTYRQQGDYENSLKYQFKSLKINEELKNKYGIAACYQGIANVYLNLKKHHEALGYYFKALELSKELDSKGAMANSYHAIAMVYDGLNDKKSALEFYLKSLEMKKILGDKMGVADSYFGLSGIYANEKNYSSALECINNALHICIEIEDVQGQGISYMNLGIIYLAQKNYYKSESSLKQALKILKEINFVDGVREVYFQLANVYEGQENYEKAFEFHKLFSDVKDSLLNEASARQITEMNTKYESEKKEKEIELLTKDKELQGAEIGKQKLIRNGVIGGLFIALLFAFVLLNRFRVTSKQKKIIEHQNSQIVESINYSKKIQDALLPSVSLMQQSLSGLFVFYEPKDIVSGDFYYFKEYEKYVLLACVDCTGHGVPGGFMSTLGSLLLDKITDNTILSPSELLLKLSDEIVRVLHQQSGGEIQDGMDLSVCMIDKKNRTVDFSGARNGITVVSNNEARRYKANPLPVGGNYMKKGQAIQRNFRTEKIQLQANDWVYMYTDGFMEQSGGESSVPMTSSEFENKLIALSQQPTESKQHYAQTELDKWRGVNVRADDVLVMGFSI